MFFKTISMKETQKWNEDEDEERKDFSIFDSSISDKDHDSAYIKKTLSRVRRDKVFLVAKVEDFESKKCFQQIIDASCFKNQIVKLNLSGKEFIISLKNLCKFPK